VGVGGLGGGGHPGGDEGPNLTLRRVAAEALKIPFVASGGMADGRSLVAAMALGAEGINMGTRFIATKEAPVHENVKQALVELSKDRGPLYRPLAAGAFAEVAAPLWNYLDALRPHLWRTGRQHPQNAAAIRQMMADGDLLMGLTFNPNEAANEIAAKRLPETVYSWQNTAGSIGNTHFLAVPFNASAREGAQVAINFMLSPQAQARKADIGVWGDPTGLAVDRLPASERERFAASPPPGQVQAATPVDPGPPRHRGRRDTSREVRPAIRWARAVRPGCAGASRPPERRWGATESSGRSSSDRG